MTNIKAVDVSEIERLQKYGLCNIGSYDVCIDRKNGGKYVRLDAVLALLDRSPSVNAPVTHKPHCNLLFPATLGTDEDCCDCGASPQPTIPEGYAQLKSDFIEACKALDDLSFNCFGGIGVCSPPLKVYNNTFKVLEKMRPIYKAMLSAYKGNEA